MGRIPVFRYFKGVDDFTFTRPNFLPEIQEPNYGLLSSPIHTSLRISTKLIFYIKVIALKSDNKL